MSRIISTQISSIVEPRYQVVNASGNWFAVFMDENFQPAVDPRNNRYFNTSLGGVTSSTQGAISTTTQISTSAVLNFMNNTSRNGEFGNDCYTAIKNWSGWFEYDFNKRARSNFSFVNSDHSTTTALIFYDGRLMLVDRKNPVVIYTDAIAYYDLTGLFSTSGASAYLNNMRGSASYNRVRSELAVLVAATPSSNIFALKVFKGVTITNDSFSITPANSVEKAVTLSASNVTEFNYRVTPVICDNGDIYISSMYPSNSLRLYKIVRSVDDTTWTTSNPQNLTLTTSYGLDTNEFHGKKVIQTVNGNSVTTFCPYYYYGAGIQSFIINKRNSTYQTGYCITDSTNGYSVVRYKEDGFAYMVNSNHFTTTPTSIIYPYLPAQSGQSMVAKTSLNLTSAPYTTTDYPVLVEAKW